MTGRLDSPTVLPSPNPPIIPMNRIVVLVVLSVSFGLTLPIQAQEGWKVHDMNRPRPPKVTPAAQHLPVSPPSDAIVLFDGTDLSGWEAVDGSPTRWIVNEGNMEAVPGAGYIQSKMRFGDVQLHVEWAAPVPARGTGQGRGNSGVFLMGLYEVQVLDSYENETYADGQAAAVYGQYPPLINASRPPGEWQTYDILFRRPRFGAAGQMLSPARLTVVHNGILVQDNVELWGPTAWLQYMPYEAHPDRLPLQFQDHGNPVLFRNIWVRDLEPEQAGHSSMRPDIALSEETLEALAGRYEMGPGNAYRIERDGGRLYFVLGDQRRFALVPRSESEFEMIHTAGTIVFDRDESGRPVGLTFTMGGGTYRANRAR